MTAEKYLLIPKVGSRIRLNTKHKNYVVGRPGEFVENTYEGEVIKYPWLKQNEIALQVSNMAHTPIVNLSRKGVSVEILSGSFKRINIENGPVVTKTVIGSKGDSYTITNKTGEWTCTCPGFQFRKNCRHIKENNG